MLVFANDTIRTELGEHLRMLIAIKTPDQLGQEVYNAAVRCLKPYISPKKSKSRNSWREASFTQPAKSGEFGAGLRTFSPGVLQTGNEVSGQSTKPLSTPSSYGQKLDACFPPLRISRSPRFLWSRLGETGPALRATLQRDHCLDSAKAV